jgi:hypothetical protein
MATLDQGVTNLQRFVANLVMATGALQKTAEHVKATGQEFAALEDQATEEGGGLNDELEEVASALDTAKNDARDAVTDLTEAATEGQGTTGGAEAKVEGVASDLEQKARAVLTDLDEAHAHLTDQGFEALGRTLDESVQELEAEGQEAEQGFIELETAISNFETEARTAWDGAEADLDEATADLGEGETALATAAAEGGQGFDAAGGQFEQRCASLEQDVDQIYDRLDAAVAEQGQEWEQQAQGVAKEATGFVETGTQQRLERPATLVEDEALASLSQEYSALRAVLDGATATASELEPLAEELQKCQTVVGQIDELLNTLAE